MQSLARHSLDRLNASNDYLKEKKKITSLAIHRIRTGINQSGHENRFLYVSEILLGEINTERF